MRRLILPAAAALFVIALLAPGCEPADGEANRGAACQTAGYAKCERTLTCNLTFTDTDQCAELLVQQCCGNADTCDDTLSAQVSAQFDACTTALRVQACDEAMSTPAACMGLSAGL